MMDKDQTKLKPNEKNSWLIAISGNITVGVVVALVSATINLFFWSWQLSNLRTDKLKDKKIEILESIQTSFNTIFNGAEDVAKFHYEFSTLCYRMEDSLKRPLTDGEIDNAHELTETRFSDLYSRIKKNDVEITNIIEKLTIANLIFKDSTVLNDMSEFLIEFNPGSRQLILNKIMIDEARNRGNRWQNVPVRFTTQKFMDTLNRTYLHCLKKIEVEVYLDNN